MGYYVHPRRLATTLRPMEETHVDRVETLLADAAAEHETLMSQLPAGLRESLPVDAQGVTRASRPRPSMSASNASARMRSSMTTPR